MSERREKRGAFIFGISVLVGILLVSFGVFWGVGVVAAEEVGRLENIYFMICADSGCGDPRIVFVSGDSPVYIRAFDFEGASLSGNIVTPSGESRDLDFTHFIGNDDFTRISLGERGVYRGAVRAEREGFIQFRGDFEFIVVDALPEIIDTREGEEEVGDLCREIGAKTIAGSSVIRGMDAIITSGDLSLVVKELSLLREGTGYDEFWNNDEFSGEISNYAGQYGFIDFDDSLSLWMTFDDKNINGEPKDLSGNGNDGVLIGDAFIGVGVFGEGLELLGSGDYVNTPDSNSLDFGTLDEMSISLWIKTSSAVRQNLVGKGDASGSYRAGKGFSLHFNEVPNAIRMSFNDGNRRYCQFDGSTPLVEIADGEWHHIVFKTEGRGDGCGVEDGVIYIDGVREVMRSGTTTTSSNTDISNIYKLDIGTRVVNNVRTNDFKGSMDELIIFKRSITEGEIFALYNANSDSFSESFGGFTCNVEGLSCNTVTDLRKLGSYKPVGDDSFGCEGFLSEELVVSGERFQGGVIEDALGEAGKELEVIASGLQCGEGCHKQIDIGIVETTVDFSNLFGLLGRDVVFDYLISCSGVENVRDWDYEVSVFGKKSCEVRR